LGAAVGPILIGRTLIDQMKFLLVLSDYRMSINVSNLILSTLLIVLCTGGVSCYTCLRRLEETPAALLRDRLPRKGNRIFIESIKVLWGAMSSKRRLIARNTSRNKWRMLMSVVGIAGCTGLVIGSFSLNDMMLGVSRLTYVDFPCNVISVDVKEGDEVGRGDLLAALDMTEYNETVKKLREQVESGKAALSDAIEDPSALEADIARLKKDLSKKTAEYNSGEKAELKLLESSLERAEKELSDAKEDLELNRKLHEEGAIATEELDGFVDAVEEKEKLRSDIIDNMSMTKRLLKEELDELSTELQYKQVQLDETRESNSASLERLSSRLAIYESDLVIMQNKANKPYVSGGSLVCSLERGIVQSISIINGSSLGQQNGNHKAMELIDADTIVVIAEGLRNSQGR